MLQHHSRDVGHLLARELIHCQSVLPEDHDPAEEEPPAYLLVSSEYAPPLLEYSVALLMASRT
jgi:hypothetical protein